MKFIADCMLGKLSRWMRILGFDVVYMKDDDSVILTRAEKEKRIILTKDSRMGSRKFKGKIYYVKSESLEDQIREVLDKFSLYKREKLFSRCPDCNALLKIVVKERVKYLVPSFIYNEKEDFALCPECEKVFWEGTHLKDMRRKLKNILKFKKKDRKKKLI